ncbi:MAG: HEAT repeat domain-containing protein [Flavobacteriales bacterium]|jgi:HEAT repeat protein|nr:HEAT repeat domain-containing protein [Flavobacteriales bacterium]
MTYSKKKQFKELFYKMVLNYKKNKLDVLISEARRNGSKSFYEFCIKKTKSNSFKERDIAITILSQLSRKGKIRPYRKEVYFLFLAMLKKEKKKEVISSLLYGISVNSENLREVDIPFLFSFSEKYKEKYMKIAVIHAISGQNFQSSIEYLIEFTSDKSAKVRDWAISSLELMEEYEDLVLPILLKGVKDTNHGVRSEAILGLIRRKYDNSGMLLFKELEGTYCLSYTLKEALKLALVNYHKLD